MKSTPSVADRFRDAILPLVDPGSDAPLVVAVSGGLDSCVLLHLLCFALPERPRLVAAHLDHGMRPGSDFDSDWTAGLCRAWNVDFRRRRADPAPTSENEARRVRYAFLDEVCSTTGARALLTAHHADDQAETVLFRILRGTGLDGLRGIRDVHGPGRGASPEGGQDGHRTPDRVRPLLGVWREELEGYAATSRIEWREDASNLDHGFARNAIRLRILPDAEALVAPGARRSLVRLGELATRDHEAWAEVLVRLATEVDTEVQRRPDGGVVRLSFDRLATAALGDALRARLLRWLTGIAGFSLDAAATRRAVDFAKAGRSGQAIQLGGGATLRRALDRLELVPPPGPDAEHPSGGEETLTISGPGTGRGVLALGGCSVEVQWDARAPAGRGPSRWSDRVASDRFNVRPTDYPLQVRGVRPGDRIRLGGGSRKVKKILLDARIPVEERKRAVLVSDANGNVVWVPPLARAPDRGPTDDAEGITITVTWPTGSTNEAG